MQDVEDGEEEGGGALNQEDDDTTIDQDLSSLHSEIHDDPSEQLPSWASRTHFNGSSHSEATQKRRSIDDQPIVPKAKTFEELLEQQLVFEGGDEVREDEDGDENAKGESPAFVRRNQEPKPFLRRGSGLARYGGVGAPKKLTPKSLRRSQSQSGSKTSLNRIDDNNKGATYAGSTSSSRLKSSKSCPKLNYPSHAASAAVNSRKASPPTKRITAATTTKAPTTLRLKQTPPAASQNGLAKPKPSHPSVSKLTGKTNDVKKKIQPSNNLGRLLHPNQTTNGTNGSEEIHDSVELSFMEKLKVAKTRAEKDHEETKTFELLEEAVCDSSFNSQSSEAKKFIQSSSHTSDAATMPSPIPKRTDSMTSTPNSKLNNSGIPSKIENALKRSFRLIIFYIGPTLRMDDERDPPGDLLMRDIKAFLENKGAVIQDAKSDENTDENDDTLVDDNEDEEEYEDENGITMDEEPRQIILNGSGNDSWSDDDYDIENEQPNGRLAPWFSCWFCFICNL